MKIVAKSKRLKAIFGLIFPLLYFPFPIYYYNKYPERLNIDSEGWLIIFSFLILFVLYYYVNGYGFIKSVLSKNILSTDFCSNLYVYDKNIILANNWTEVYVMKKFGLNYFIIKNGINTIESVYGNCADKSFFKKSKLKNKLRYKLR
jgi:hypothetical protein